MNRFRKWANEHKILATIAVGLPVFLCVCCVAIPFIPTPIDSDEPISAESVIESQSNTGMTKTLTPTNSPTSTPKPTSTSTPLPPAPSCNEIKMLTRDMTDVQWEKYKRDFVGLWVENWEGKVTQVSKEFLGSNYNVHVRTPDGCDILVEVKDEETALTVSRGDSVVVSGSTSSLADIFGKVIYLDDELSHY